jgi:putative thioredoxin
MSGPHVIDVTEADFESRVLEASHTRPVVVDFWAGWCQPCLILGPILERVAEEHGGRFVLAKLDVDANQQISAAFRIQGIPAVKAFKDGTVVSEFVGAQPEQMVRRFVDALVPSEADELAASVPDDPEEAERAYRAALEIEPRHPAASAGLASLLLGRGELEAARTLLSAASPSPEVDRVQAEIELHRSAAEGGELAAAARAAVSGDHRQALERALDALRDGQRDEARELLVKLFAILGDDHELTREFRPRLAKALY